MIDRTDLLHEPGLRWSALYSELDPQNKEFRLTLDSTNSRFPAVEPWFRYLTFTNSPERDILRPFLLATSSKPNETPDALVIQILQEGVEGVVGHTSHNYWPFPIFRSRC